MKISFKLGLWFFICIFIIESLSMLYLHREIVHSLLTEELNALQARGNSHRNVLELSFDEATLKHIGLMETQTNTEVVITDHKGKVLQSSKTIDPFIQTILNKPIPDLNRNGLVIQSDWKDEQYISTISPINEDDTTQGYIYMLKSTKQMQNFISQLNNHFIFASILILLFLFVTIFFLTKALTKPLISMKEATKKLSSGDFSVSLPINTTDELGELSASIQSLATDLDYLKKERNAFLSSVSHELRTPLTYIKGYADIGRKISITDHDRINYMEIIHEESERVNELLEELFNLAKMDQNQFSIMKQQTNIHNFSQAIYEKVLPVFKDREIMLQFDCPKDLYLFIDPKRFEQVFLNLLDNARKYSPSQTTITWKIYKQKDTVHFVLSDQGNGIPQEDLPFVFDRLFRVEKSRSRLTGGFGLGLSIVKEIVEAHGGNISVQSRLGKGTIFHITLKEQSNEKNSTN